VAEICQQIGLFLFVEFGGATSLAKKIYNIAYLEVFWSSPSSPSKFSPSLN
jgi:hypothetical protein